MKEPEGFRCRQHPGRIAAAMHKCWECLIGKEEYEHRFNEQQRVFMYGKETKTQEAQTLHPRQAVGQTLFGGNS
jgi:hypothetical protein